MKYKMHIIIKKYHVELNIKFDKQNNSIHRFKACDQNVTNSCFDVDLQEDLKAHNKMI